MKLTKDHLKLLDNWDTLTKNITSIDSETAIELMKYEKRNSNRTTFVKRLEQRAIGAAVEETKNTMNT